MKTHKVCIVTGARAEYGLLSCLMKAIQEDEALELVLVVTGMHLSPEYGLTYRDILDDGFNIDDRVEMLLSSDTPVGVAKSIGLGVIGFAQSFDRLRPDIVVLAGDRYEMLAAAQAALVAKIPVAHIFGGDSTEGAFDEAIRHSITKMSHIHFVTNDVAAKRVCQLGEDPSRVHNVGSMGIDRLNRVRLLDREALQMKLGFRLRSRNILVTYHPATLGMQPSSQCFGELLKACDQLGVDVGIVFTYPNADTDGRIIIAMIQRYVQARDNARAYVSLGQELYFSTIANMDAVVGNSSSGIYEVPAFKIPTVNVGDRQRGRILADSVISCDNDEKSIVNAIKRSFTMDCSKVLNPYGDGNTTTRIMTLLKEYVHQKRDGLKKHFFDYDGK